MGSVISRSDALAPQDLELVRLVLPISKDFPIVGQKDKNL